MRPPLSRLAALGAYVAVCFLIWLSYSSYSASFTPVGRWQAATNDPADYRFIAEYFWGVPFHPETYDSIWHGGWGDYLRLIPFRSIGLGSFYLLAGWLRLGHAPATPDEVIAAGIALAYAQKALLAIALLVLFAVVRRRWNTALALFAVAVDRVSADLLADLRRLPDRAAAAHRLPARVRLRDRAERPAESERRPARAQSPRSCCSVSGSSRRTSRSSGTSERSCCCRCWSSKRRRGNLVSRRALALAAAALLVPVSVIAVNWIGWRTTTLSPGFGLHANLRYEGDVLREYSAIMATAPSRPAFADPERPRLRWWHIYVGPEVTRAEYEAFDSFGTAIPAAAPGLRAAQLLDRPAARVDGPWRSTNHAGPHPARAARPAMGHAGSLARHRNLDPARHRARFRGDASPLCAGARPVDRPGHRQHRLAVRAEISPADVRDRRRRCRLRRRDASAALRQAQGRPEDYRGTAAGT